MKTKGGLNHVSYAAQDGWFSMDHIGAAAEVQTEMNMKIGLEEELVIAQPVYVWFTQNNSTRRYLPFAMFYSGWKGMIAPAVSTDSI